MRFRVIPHTCQTPSRWKGTGLHVCMHVHKANLEHNVMYVSIKTLPGGKEQVYMCGCMYVRQFWNIT